MSGASGFLGTALTGHLRAQGHQVTRLVRRPSQGGDEQRWDPYAEVLKLGTPDAVINLSGVGLVKGAAHRADAIALMEHLTGAASQRLLIQGSEFAVDPDVGPPPHLEAWANVKEDPIDVARAGTLLPDAVALMQKVGWR